MSYYLRRLVPTFHRLIQTIPLNLETYPSSSLVKYCPILSSSLHLSAHCTGRNKLKDYLEDPTKYTIEPIKLRRTGGRNNTGRITVHGRGGGRDRIFKWVDHERQKVDDERQAMEERVIELTYDHCRTAHIALTASGNHKRYVLASENMKVGDLLKSTRVISRHPIILKEGDSHPVGSLPIGTLVHNVEIRVGRGGQFCRSAGTCAQVVRKMEGEVLLQLPSKRQIKVDERCAAVVGRVSNVIHGETPRGKAGVSRWLGFRPSSGLWHRKGGWAGRKIRPIPPPKDYVGEDSKKNKRRSRPITSYHKYKLHNRVK